MVANRAMPLRVELYSSAASQWTSIVLISEAPDGNRANEFTATWPEHQIAKTR